MRSSNGCWTCRLRRKKCDETYPVCAVCSALDITCHYQDEKPEWMDGGVKQDKMAECVKREVKEKARHRREGGYAVHTSSEPMVISQDAPSQPNCPVSNLLETNTMQPSPEPSILLFQNGARNMYSSQGVPESMTLKRSEAVLFTFYLETLFPFLFPFYRPSYLQGGKAWILEMIISRPVVRQAVLCQSVYFFSLAQGTAADCDLDWEKVLTQTGDAFGVLRQALQVIGGSGIAEHMHGAVRIMSSIMQLQCFEIAILSFHNWQNHLNAALALFKQLLDSVPEPGEPCTNFDTVMSHLDSSSSWPGPDGQVPSAEQAAFRFSSALVIFDDIIASTVLQTQPRLYEYHCSLLGNIEGTSEPVINLEAIVGLKNWTLLQIGEISTLDAWKQQCIADGNLDVVELVHRASAIKESLATHLASLNTDPAHVSREKSSILDVFASPVCQGSLVTRVWTHAALLYLSTVVSGWQPANDDVRSSVSQVIEILLKGQISPTVLRTMAWPFCVSGCLADPAQEAQFRGVVELLQPPSFFGTMHEALEIMENVWRHRGVDGATRDLATCFRTRDDLVLLV